MRERDRSPYPWYIPGSAAGSPAPDTGISPVNIVMPEGLTLDPERMAAMRKASGCIAGFVKTALGIK